MNEKYSTSKGNQSSFISANEIKIDKNYFQEKGGILNALTTASAQYIYKVIEKYNRGNSIKWFDLEKTKKLHRSIIHTNAHLDEYFAELLFRAILPPNLKDLEIKEHTLISKDNDTFAKISWPNAVVFGLRNEAGGASALQIFDEHNSDGTRIRPSCSQLVTEDYVSNIPESIQIVLNDVNMSDSNKGAHQYNLKNIISSMHDTLFIIGPDEFGKGDITKYLTENWKRSIINTSITAMIYAYENRIFLNKDLDEKSKMELERTTKQSLDYFLENTLLKTSKNFDKVKGTILYHFKVGNNGKHETIDNAKWKDENDNEISKQILIIHRICYALEKCWGKEISKFVMMHIWQSLFQQQLMFKEIQDEINDLPTNQIIKTKFGSVKKLVVDRTLFKPEQKITDKRKRKFNIDSPFWLFDISLSVPDYYNVATAFKALINNEYTQKGNNGFGLILLHDKTMNSKLINTGPTVPYNIWTKISDAVHQTEPDRWFQLKGSDGKYADYILNRTKAHQEHLPSNKIDIEFIKSIIKSL